jgi:plastocyanin
MPKHYEIKIHLVKGVSVKSDASPVLHIGDTVRYICKEGVARVVFQSGSPYAVSKVHDTHNHTVKKTGHFRYECYVTPTGKTKEISYDRNNPKSGGEHEVVP